MRMGMAGLVGVMTMFVAGAAMARNDAYPLSVDEVLADPAAQAQMAKGVTLYWGDKKPAGDYTTIGPFNVTEHAYRDERHTPDLVVCRKALTLALSDVTRHAAGVGGNAAVAVEAEIEKQRYPNPAAIMCHVGARGTTITLHATIVKAGP